MIGLPEFDNRRCETCKWWTGAGEFTYENDTVKIQGVCGGINSQWSWRLQDGDPGDELAMMVDRNAELLTAPTFGCRLWEPHA